jgi:hypothetical protein
MPNLLDFATLLNGMSEEAKNVRLERAKQENDTFEQGKVYLQGLLSNERVPQATRDQAQQALMQMTMEHMGYGKMKGAEKNPVRKMITGLIGDRPNDYSKNMSQVGVGSGNAKNEVGTLPPQQRQGDPDMSQQPIPQLRGAIGGGDEFMPQPPPGPPPSPWSIPQKEMDQMAASRAGMTEGAKAQALTDVETKRQRDLIATTVASSWFKGMNDRAKQAVMAKLVTGVTLEGSVNTPFAPESMTYDQLQRAAPAVAAQFQGFKPDEWMSVQVANGAIVSAVPAAIRPTANSNIGKVEQVPTKNPATGAVELRSFQFNPETNRYDIPLGDVGRPVPKPGARQLVKNAQGQYTGYVDSEIGEITYFDNPVDPSKASPTIPALDPTTRTTLAGWDLALDGLNKVVPQLQSLKSQLGIIPGNITLGEINKLGGMGASKEAISLATRLERLLMSQAFAEGGKVLTETELSFFKKINPHLTDTFAQAITKAQESLDYIASRRALAVRLLNPQQRSLVPPAPFDMTDQPPLPNGGGQVIDSPTIRLFLKAAGNDPAKAEALASQYGWKP